MTETESHTTPQGCVVTVRAVGPSVEVVVRQADGRTATYACKWQDMVTIHVMLATAAGHARDAEGT